jgi:HEAT repeat protein
VLTGFIDIASVALILFLPKTVSHPMLGAIFFLSGAVNIAFQASMQHYFLSITNRKQQLPLGIFTQGLGGIAAGVALYAGGWSLAALQEAAALSRDPLLHFRWFFGGLLALMALRTVILFRLPRLKSRRVRDALSALTSPGDWRAAYAVKRALALQSEDEETRALDAMRGSSAAIFHEDLRHYLGSPSFFVRQQALVSLMTTRPSPELVQTMMEDLRVNRFLTAHLAAECLGRWQVKEAAPLLQAVVFSKDFLLSAKAIHALVELGEKDVTPLLEIVFTSSENPLVLIEGARALSLWGGLDAYPLLLEKYALDLPPQVKDELSLAIARVLGLYDALYLDLGMLHRDRGQLEREWRDRMRAGVPDAEALLSVLRDPPPPAQLAGEAPTERAVLLAALERRERLLTEPFYRAMRERLERQPDPLDRNLAFLLAFLLLTPRGEHWRETGKAGG